MRVRIRSKRIVAMAAMAIALPEAPPAQEQQESLPSAREVIEKFIEKTGGRASYEKFKTRVITGKVNFFAMDQTFTGTFTRYHSAPNLMYMRVDLGEFGTMESGTDGKVHWELSTMAGARVFSGLEKAMAEREARFYHHLEWFDLYERLEVKGKETIEGTPCYLLRMTPTTGNAEDAYLEETSGLLAATLTDHPANIGELTVWTTFDNFKAIDGLHLPHRIYYVLEEAGQEFEMLIEKIEHDVAIPASRYELPAAIKALIGE